MVIEEFWKKKLDKKTIAFGQFQKRNQNFEKNPKYIKKS
jgi:hypothetical protein